jgi:alpha-mannosidase
MKPSNDGKAIVLRLYEVGGKDAAVNLKWQGHGPKATWLSNVAEEPVTAVNGPIAVPANDVISVRVEF